MATSTSNSSPDDFEKKLLEVATKYQQSFYEICSDWNLYEKEQYAYLRDFIGYALFGPPEFRQYELLYSDKSKQGFNHFLYDEKKQGAINLIFEKVTEYGINEDSKGVVLCGIIYNVILKKQKYDEVKADANKSNANDVEMVYPVPVFKVRAYKNKLSERTKESEKNYYIDNVGRVYDGFVDYLTTNTLPECTMIVPKDGRYQANPEFCSEAHFMVQNMDTARTKVWIEVHDSPACDTTAKVLTAADVASMVISTASMGILVAGMVTPIGAGIALGGAAGAGLSGLWTAGRSAQQLADRGKHGESINVTDKNALGAWIGVAGGTMGLAATGGSVLLTRAIRTGATVGNAAKMAYNAVQIGSLVVNGVGIGYKSYDIYEAYTEGSGVSKMDVFLLSAHVFFFCNSVINTRLAQNLIECTQTQLLKDYEASLRSNRHRKEFQRMVRNTRATGNSNVSSNEEIIRAINMIDDRDQFFQSMVRNRKAFSASSAKVSFSSNGKVTINGIMTIDPIEFASLPKEIRVGFVRGVNNVQSSHTPSVKVSGPGTGNNQVYNEFRAKSSTVLENFCSQHPMATLQKNPVIIGDFGNVLGDLRNMKNKLEIFLKLLNLGRRILQALPRDEEATIGDTLAFIVQFLWDYIKSNLHKIRPGISIEDPSMQDLLDTLIDMLLRRIEENLDEWVRAFTQWLKTQFPQMMNEPFFQRQQFK